MINIKAPFVLLLLAVVTYAQLTPLSAPLPAQIQNDLVLCGTPASLWGLLGRFGDNVGYLYDYPATMQLIQGVEKQVSKLSFNYSINTRRNNMLFCLLTNLINLLI